MTHADKLVVILLAIVAVWALIRTFNLSDLIDGVKGSLSWHKIDYRHEIQELRDDLASLTKAWEVPQRAINRDYGERLVVLEEAENENGLELALLKKLVQDATRNGAAQRDNILLRLNALSILQDIIANQQAKTDAKVSDHGLSLDALDDDVDALFGAFDSVRQQLGLDPIAMDEVIPTLVDDLRILEARVNAIVEAKRGKK